ncbi:MAG: shikimate dehydrogenase [Firmicutes bacterium]|nr:shikimate dehydrogenase [Bacillota bacterium]
MRNLLGIIGKPLGHSLSPLLHNVAIEKLKSDYKYKKWELEESELKQFFINLRKEDSNILGFNVTIPYKEKVIPYLDELDELAIKLKAVNTVKYENGKLKGYNTDGLGFLETLIKNNIEFKNKNFLILGSGGACKGIALFLAQNNVSSIDIVARNKNESSIISNDLIQLGIESENFSWYDLPMLNIAKYQIIVQTTPLGMKNNNINIDFPYEKLSNKQIIIDIVYNPIETNFLKNGKLNNVRCLNGLEMLVYQGYHSFKIWTGLEEDTNLMLNTGKKILEGERE